MSVVAARITQGNLDPAAPGVRGALRLARAGLYVGATAAVALAVLMFFETASSASDYTYKTADYLLTANGIPFMLAPVAVLLALRTLFGHRLGRLGRVGVAIMGIALLAFQPIFIYGLVVGREESFGPTYILASLATVLGLFLFAAALWRARLLPRWLVSLWAVAWFVGGGFPVGPKGAPVLLAAVYLAIAAYLGRAAERAR